MPTSAGGAAVMATAVMAGAGGGGVGAGGGGVAAGMRAGMGMPTAAGAVGASAGGALMASAAAVWPVRGAAQEHCTEPNHCAVSCQSLVVSLYPKP